MSKNILKEQLKSVRYWKNLKKRFERKDPGLVLSNQAAQKVDQDIRESGKVLLKEWSSYISGKGYLSNPRKRTPHEAYRKARYVDKKPSKLAYNLVKKCPITLFRYLVVFNQEPSPETREICCQNPEVAKLYTKYLDKV